MAKSEKVSPLEEGLLMAMAAIDKQIAREMQRSPDEREKHGVQKWEPFQKRIEKVASIAVEALGDEKIQIDSLLVFSQAYTKTLRILVEELGEEALGEVRTAYCLSALEQIRRDAEDGLQFLQGEGIAYN